MNQNYHLSEKTYSIGDTVGIRIHKVDRTNTDSNILHTRLAVSFTVRFFWQAWIEVRNFQ
jgi:hypothetical protein